MDQCLLPGRSLAASSTRFGEAYVTITKNLALDPSLKLELSASRGSLARENVNFGSRVTERSKIIMRKPSPRARKSSAGPKNPRQSLVNQKQEDPIIRGRKPGICLKHTECEPYSWNGQNNYLSKGSNGQTSAI